VIAAIIQARTGSTRLPKKVLAKIEGKPMLWHIIERVKKAKNINEIIIATTNRKEDKKIIKIAKKSGVKSFAGSEEDVLDRYYKAAEKYNTDIIVRITGDCPFVDPEIIDKIVEFFKKNNFDYVSTGHITKQKHELNYPAGLNTEVFSFSALKKAWKQALLPSEREHVTPYIWKNDKLFKIRTINSGQNFSHMRWTVDEKQDLKLIREVYKKLYSDQKIFLMQDILDLFKKEPYLMEINKGIKRDEGYLKSLKKD
jgi:spore coat polysaccharide biosynthesis protein SpsF (cytidylyltransferase family)